MKHRLTLAAYPQGLPGPEHFHLDSQPIPEPADGQVLLRTLYLSVDPYQRNLMAPVGPGYAPPVPLGGVMVGGTVSRVVASRHAGFRPGELVLANAGWQDYSLSDGSDLLALGDVKQPSHALGGLGMPGFTAYVGLLDIGQPKPGETVVVAAATGAVGSVVGQLAKLKGARVVGIAGGADKCRHAVEVLGFDACLDRREPELARRLAEACPQGIDVYFENVGGDVLAAVLPLLNLNARMPVCGFISHYNDAAPVPGPDLASVLAKRIRVQGFIILDHYGERFDAFRRDMGAWLAEGRITLREDIVDGLEQAPAALARLLQGGNFGKTVVRVSES
ncbi:NADPH-dependent curcumin reductase CurA [Pelomonas saccharophila]|uniref:NADPH-dependent curcumin reductase CurA n=1 Tax=Roseateles saccharophilus TaxID=304 RepID=A0ABU1YP35_ROSSA|nr:NADP-dependent oxidoreductase [Roseateles saccharophilus]MDR7270625.1 NADPH-dependent curcumin reductase CurA [Roseateles saccharophilus]